MIELNDEEQKKLALWLDKMVNEDMPIQYLLGTVPFNNLEIIVEPPVLIPRPETEEWTSALVEKLKPLAHKKLNILDICCGTGCIALSLAKALPQAHIFAVDISDKAIALAKQNAHHNKITNATFIQSDLYNEIETDKLFDLIVSNPPYISFDEFEDLDNSVATWEDPQALVAADDGLAIIEDIIEDAPDYLKINHEMNELNIPQFWVEIGSKQAKDVLDFCNSFGFIDAQIHKDLEGKDRYVTAHLETK
jgi:release factor glutamine methyltransferase